MPINFDGARQAFETAFNTVKQTLTDVGQRMADAGQRVVEFFGRKVEVQRPEGPRVSQTLAQNSRPQAQPLSATQGQIEVAQQPRVIAAAQGAQPAASIAPGATKPWMPTKELGIPKSGLERPGVLSAPSRAQGGVHALHTKAFQAFFERGVHFPIPSGATRGARLNGTINIGGKDYNYSATGTVAKGSGAGIWMVQLTDAAGASGSTEFVIKANPKKGDETDADMREFFRLGRQKDLREVQVLDLMSGNDHALQFHGGYSMPDGTLVYAMEKAQGDMLSVLDSRIEAKAGGTLTPSDADKHLLEMAQALRDLHATGQVHGDVKSDNFMLGSDGTARIADFGESYVTDPSVRSEILNGDVERFATMAFNVRYGVRETTDTLARAIRSQQTNGGSPEDIRSNAINDLLLEAVRHARPDFNYMASFTERLGRLIEREATTTTGRPAATVDGPARAQPQTASQSPAHTSLRQDIFVANLSQDQEFARVLGRVFSDSRLTEDEKNSLLAEMEDKRQSDGLAHGVAAAQPVSAPVTSQLSKFRDQMEAAARTLESQMSVEDLESLQDNMMQRFFSLNDANQAAAAPGYERLTARIGTAIAGHAALSVAPLGIPPAGAWPVIPPDGATRENVRSLLLASIEKISNGDLPGSDIQNANRLIEPFAYQLDEASGWDAEMQGLFDEYQRLVTQWSAPDGVMS